MKRFMPQLAIILAAILAGASILTGRLRANEPVSPSDDREKLLALHREDAAEYSLFRSASIYTSAIRIKKCGLRSAIETTLSTAIVTRHFASIEIVSSMKYSGRPTYPSPKKNESWPVVEVLIDSIVRVATFPRSLSAEQ